MFGDGASWARLDLTGANFSGADLRGAWILSANLTGVNFSGANVTATPSGLGPVNFAYNTWNNTVCPDGTNSSAYFPQTCIGHGF